MKAHRAKGALCAFILPVCRDHRTNVQNSSMLSWHPPLFIYDFFLSFLLWDRSSTPQDGLIQVETPMRGRIQVFSTIQNTKTPNSMSTSINISFLFMGSYLLPLLQQYPNDELCALI